MEHLGVIARVEVPTEWCAGMVVPNGKIRICVDLNHSVMQERHLLPAVEQTLAGAKVFTKMDANSSFWQTPLAPDSAHHLSHTFRSVLFPLLTIRDHFRTGTCHMSTLLDGIDGVVCLMDDILIHGTEQLSSNTLSRALQQQRNTWMRSDNNSDRTTPSPILSARMARQEPADTHHLPVLLSGQ